MNEKINLSLAVIPVGYASLLYTAYE